VLRLLDVRRELRANIFNKEALIYSKGVNVRYSVRIVIGRGRALGHVLRTPKAD
jgi:hypothetical protein